MKFSCLRHFRLQVTDRVPDTSHKKGDVASALCRSALRRRADGAQSGGGARCGSGLKAVHNSAPSGEKNVTYRPFKRNRAPISHHSDDTSKHKWYKTTTQVQSETSWGQGVGVYLKRIHSMLKSSADTSVHSCKHLWEQVHHFVWY